jgi:hypothetical protein
MTYSVDINVGLYSTKFYFSTKLRQKTKEGFSTNKDIVGGGDLTAAINAALMVTNRRVRAIQSYSELVHFT